MIWASNHELRLLHDIALRVGRCLCDKEDAAQGSRDRRFWHNTG